MSLPMAAYCDLDGTVGSTTEVAAVQGMSESFQNEPDLGGYLFGDFLVEVMSAVHDDLSPARRQFTPSGGTARIALPLVGGDH